MCVCIFSFDGLMNLYQGFSLGELSFGKVLWEHPLTCYAGLLRCQHHKFKQNPIIGQYKKSHFYHLEVISRYFLQFERFLGAMGGYAAEAWGKAL